MRTSDSFVNKVKIKLTIWRRPSHFIIIDSFDCALNEFDIFFRKRLVKPHKTAVFTSGVFDIWSSTFKPFPDRILYRKKGLVRDVRKERVWKV